MNETASSRHPVVGWLLVAAGAVGVITGLVPLTINVLRVAVDERLWNLVDLAAHGVESLGLSLEWAVLSSAMGTCLGVLLLWAGVGWLKGRPWAAAVSGAYVLAGLAVNASDMLIFARLARPGATRTLMLLADGIALMVPVLLGAWLLQMRSGRRQAVQEKP
jgi:hypothetical protein